MRFFANKVALACSRRYNDGMQAETGLHSVVTGRRSREFLLAAFPPLGGLSFIPPAPSVELTATRAASKAAGGYTLDVSRFIPDKWLHPLHPRTLAREFHTLVKALVTGQTLIDTAPSS